MLRSRITQWVFCTFLITVVLGCDEISVCKEKESAHAKLDTAIDLIIEAKKSFVCPTPKTAEKPMDCSDVLNYGHNTSGVYTIYPTNRVLSKDFLRVYCDMDTDGGGWTVIQRRGNFSKAADYFYRKWVDYKVGFGNVKEDFWLGNDNIFALTNQKMHSVRFDLQDYNGVSVYAHYDKFWIDDEDHDYRLHIKYYSGNAGDAMAKHDEQKFSTAERQNHNSPKTNCAEYNRGSWWYNNCYTANLNGLYMKSEHNNTGITWHPFRKYETLAAADIKIRPIKFSSEVKSDKKCC